MQKKKEEHKILKYFEITLGEARDWDSKDYIMFVIESLYLTVFPFISGMLLVSKKQIIWLLMLVLPIYFKFKIQRKFTKKPKKQKFYIR